MSNVKIDVSVIPDCVKEQLAAATLDYIKRIFAQPNGREMIEKKKSELNL